MPGLVPQVTCGCTALGVQHDPPIEGRARIATQPRPGLHRASPRHLPAGA